MSKGERMKFSSAVAAILALAAAVSVTAQTPPAASRAQLSGTVTSVKADANQLSLKADKGQDVSVTTTDRTLILRIPPGETDPKKGSKIALSSLSPGDRAVIIGATPSDPKAWTATAVLVMSKSDVAGLQQKEQDDWKKRGTIGTVTAIDPTAKTITIKGGQRTVTVQPSDKTEFHRYSLDSANFSDAKPSTFAEVKTGDQVHVLGNKSRGWRLPSRPRRSSAGTFRQIAATIVSIDAADRRNEGQGSGHQEAPDHPRELRFHHEETARPIGSSMLARRYVRVRERRRAAAAAVSARRTRPPAAGRGGGLGGRAVAAGRRRYRADARPVCRRCRLPISNPGRHHGFHHHGKRSHAFTAIMLLAGVEPILTASPIHARHHERLESGRRRRRQGNSATSVH